MDSRGMMRYVHMMIVMMLLFPVCGNVLFVGGEKIRTYVRARRGSDAEGEKGMDPANIEQSNRTDCMVERRNCEEDEHCASRAACARKCIDQHLIEKAISESATMRASVERRKRISQTLISSGTKSEHPSKDLIEMQRSLDTLVQTVRKEETELSSVYVALRNQKNEGDACRAKCLGEGDHPLVDAFKKCAKEISESEADRLLRSNGTVLARFRGEMTTAKISSSSARAAAAAAVPSAGSCPSPGYPEIFAYQIPKPSFTSEVRKWGYQGDIRDHCDDLTSVSPSCCHVPPYYVHNTAYLSASRSASCPCSSCSRMNIVYSKEKAEMIAITRATDKALAVCRNARICVTGLERTDRFEFLDTRDHLGLCRRWIGGDTSKCFLDVSTDIERISGGWRVKVRMTVGEEQWTFPVDGLLRISMNFQVQGPLNLRTESARTLAALAKSAPQQVLVVGRDHEDVLIYDIQCSEAARGYALTSGPPAMPPYVRRKPTCTDCGRDVASVVAKIESGDIYDGPSAEVALNAAKRALGLISDAPPKKAPAPSVEKAPASPKWSSPDGSVAKGLKDMAESQSQVATAMNSVSKQMAGLTTNIQKLLDK